MKNIMLIFAITVLSSFTFGQSAYEKEMVLNITRMDQATSPKSLDVLAQEFSSVSKKNPNDWLPYYYTALAYLNKGHMLYDKQELSRLDALADEADRNIAAAEKLTPMNPELYILKKMSHRLRMLVDPMSRFMTELQASNDALAMARKLDPSNPRVTLLEAQDLYYTPENYGGNKAQAIEMFKKSIEQFKTFKPKTPLDPSWGQKQAERFLKDAQK